MRTPDQLTPKQSRFIQEYLVDGNGAQAAIRCGSPAAGAHVWASRTLRIAKVSEALQAAQVVDATRLSISRENVLEWLQSAFLAAREKGDPAAMVSAAREIGRMMGFYAPEVKKVALTIDQNDTQARFSRMSDRELLDVMAHADMH
jgi:hypothetical protein